MPLLHASHKRGCAYHTGDTVSLLSTRQVSARHANVVIQSGYTYDSDGNVCSTLSKGDMDCVAAATAFCK